MDAMIADNFSMAARRTAPALHYGFAVAPDSLSGRMSGTIPGNFPDSDELSLTVCPVHGLSITQTEWVEMAWAARNAAQDGVNLERRGWFEGVKCLLRERDLPPSKKFHERVWQA